MNHLLSLAPMEGIITYIYRNAYVKHYGGFDKYYTPFITSPNLGLRELQEVDPEKNKYQGLIPQILTNKADTFLSIAGELKSLGYNTYNLNLGCPSGTVVSKHRGSGLLKYPEELESFLDDIFSGVDGKISIKTRIGFENQEEWTKILEIFSHYPMDELIVHPRLRIDQYKGPIHMDAWKQCYEQFAHKLPLTYNGDLCTMDSVKSITEAYPEVSGTMIGRGILKRPGFVVGNNDLSTLKAFHDDIYNGYKEIMFGEKPVIFKMKEIWGFMGYSLEDSQRIIKKIQKTKNLAEYDIVVKDILKNESISW